jgi:hypothetical protein
MYIFVPSVICVRPSTVLNTDKREWTPISIMSDTHDEISWQLHIQRGRLYGLNLPRSVMVEKALVRTNDAGLLQIFKLPLFLNWPLKSLAVHMHEIFMVCFQLFCINQSPIVTIHSISNIFENLFWIHPDIRIFLSLPIFAESAKRNWVLSPKT